MSSSAHADPELNIAVKGGLAAATQDREFRAHRYGFTGGFGASLQWSLSDRFLLAGHLELLYTPRGADLVADGFYQGTFEEQYFDAVLAARPGVRLGRADLYLLLGGGVDLLLSARTENPSGFSMDITDALRRTDVALLIGAGVALHLPRRAVGPFSLGTAFLEARHDHGLLDIDLGDGEIRNRTTSVMLGFSFGLGARPDPSKAPSVQDTPPAATTNPAP